MFKKNKTVTHKYLRTQRQIHKTICLCSKELGSNSLTAPRCEWVAFLTSLSFYFFTSKTGKVTCTIAVKVKLGCAKKFLPNTEPVRGV